MKRRELEGMVFGDLTVISRVEGSLRSKWVCKCKCGNTIEVFQSNLVRRNTISCHQRGKKLITHNKYKHPCYSSWRSMMQRCENPNASDYSRYGGKGIRVCDRWLNIENFIEDMGVPLSNEMTIDRIDNSLGYFKENCRWVSRYEQSCNRSNTIFLEGVPLPEWCKINNLPYKLVFERQSRGWDANKIKTTPVQKKSNEICCVDGCSNTVDSKHLCYKHYLREWKRLRGLRNTQNQ